MPRDRKEVAQCPKCGSSSLQLIEIWAGSTIVFDQVAGEIVDSCGDEGGDPFKVEARCACGHEWRLRGVMQISDLPNWERWRDHVKSGR